MATNSHPTLERNCNHCNQPYQARKDSLKKGMGLYCSKDCHGIVRRSVRVKLTCGGCGNEFDRIPSHVREGGFFCSRKCHGQNRQRIPLADRFWEKVDIREPDQCWPWKAGRSTGGYGRIMIGSGNQKVDQASRIVWELTFGPIPDGLWALHSCDNRKCCNPKHLFLGTNQDNTDDKVSKGRQLRGETSPVAKLIDEEVITMRRRHAEGETIKALAADYNIHYQTAYKILRGLRWKHLP